MSMESSLFRVRPIRRGYLAAMVVGSLLLHAGIVGLGAVFWQPISKPLEIPATEIQIGDPDVRELIVPYDAPTPPPDQPTPPPEETPPPEDTPPPTEEPDMTEPEEKPSPTPPKPKTAARPAATPAPPNAKRGPVAQTGVVGGNPNGTKATGTPGSPTGSKVGWSTRTPPYPYQARATRIQGSTTVSITTDGGGNITGCNITKSAGNSLLDSNTTSYVRANWKGPPNSTKSVTFVYTMH